ncbi:MAG: hypothetical protein ACFHWX_08210 [Bacteroidota bacterium]
MRKLNFAITMLVVATIFSGCKLGTMIKLASDQDLTIDPNPLELKGDEVPFTMSAVLPPKMLPSGTMYTINTIYQYGDQEVAVGSVDFQASDFPNSSSSTSRKSEDFSFPYQDGMNPGTLYVEGVATIVSSGKSKTSPRMEVAKGLVTTASFAKPVVLTALADHGYNDKEELEPTNIDFYFEQGRSVVNPRIATDGTSNRTKTQNMSAFIAEKNVTRTVTITGTHSPEGTETINSDLSNDRAAAIEKYYRAQMSRYDYKDIADEIDFILKPVVQDWGAFKAALADYDGISASEKSEYTNIINGSGTFVDKEKQLQKLPTYKKVFNDIYPGLRSAKTEILTVVEKKPNATIAVLAKSIVSGSASMDTLTMNEFLFAATLTPSLDEKEAIYMAATKSGDWRAHNNLGAVKLEKAKMIGNSDAMGKMALIEDALTQLEIAGNKQSSPVVSTNLAAAAMLKGDKDAAADAINEGMSASPSNMVSAKLKGMQGSLQLMSGDYDEAKASFASAEASEEVTFDKGLVSLLTGDAGTAQTTLNGVTDSEAYGADAYYLKAIASAKQNNAEAVGANLKQAVSKDASLKEKALNDLSFGAFANAVAEAVR